jgi:hypothetical protein
MFPYNLTLVYFLHRQKDREGSRSRDAHENTCSHRYLLYSLILPTVDPPLQKNIPILSQRKVYLGADLGLQIISRDSS